MLIQVSILGTATADTPGVCVVLNSNNTRYIFGHVAEGTQRLITQRKAGLVKLRHIFLTGNIDWHTVGGLPGTLLSAAEATEPLRIAARAYNEKRREKGKAGREKDPRSHGIHIHGGPNLTHTLAATRNFVYRKNMPIKLDEICHDTRGTAGTTSSKPDWEDAYFRVWNVPLTAAGPSICRTPGPSESLVPQKRRLSTPSEPDPGDAARLETEQVSDADRSEADRLIRSSIVESMFSMDGEDKTPDILVPLPLSDVGLPAEMFVRENNEFIKYEGPVPDPHNPRAVVFVQRQFLAGSLARLPGTQPCLDSMCYIVKSHPRRGKFNPDAARSYGLEKLQYRLLTSGETVTGKTPPGVIVTPDMVMSAQVEGQGFAVIDIRNLNLIDSLLARPEWTNEEIMQGIQVMYWSLGPQIKDDSRLAAFMQKHSSIKHILLGQGVSPNTLAFTSTAEQFIKLNVIDPDRFPLTVFSNKPSELSEELSSVAEVGESSAAFLLAPKPGVVKGSEEPLMDTTLPAREVMTNAAIMSLVESARQRIADPAFLSQMDAAERGMPGRDVEIVTLGTGSALPSKYRNVSATLIRVPGHGSYLLDCGENTLGQLRRSYGYEGADEVLRDLRAVYISHLHADHHLGIVSVLARRHVLVGNTKPPYPLSVIATTNLLRFLDEFNEVQDFGFRSGSIHKVFTTRLKHKSRRYECPRRVAPETIAGMHAHQKSGLPNVDVCMVRHTPEATAVVFTWPESAGGLKIAYSGDCRPSSDFASLGRGADLLIHECTFDNEVDHAIAKSHSTMSEALGVARNMGARKLLLTHFSQRYPKLPVIGGGGDEGEVRNEDGSLQFDGPILSAFDLMRVKLGDFRKAQLFVPAIQELLNETVEEPEDAGEELDELMAEQ
ncbi:hypothetical protein B0T24DRAFT_632098 [Lasiosphaeria ovina]|uniref:ribonuclease Z n=1 Tax=Lasiosphaeria ovina TaxID=92902 RepID=A0AAE0K432_9PEZI|nr:hypothetical protein B0T24DRAFT_632098 [Lasiosphaeria ovina]